MNWNQRHLIIIPANLQVQANAEAVKWDPDVGGDQTFGGAALSSDGGATLTHYVSCTLIDDEYVPPGQGGQTALQVLDAFYATAWYQGYRVIRPQGDTSALMEGEVEAWRPARLDDEGNPLPAGWEALGTGRLVELALADAGLVRYEPPEPEPEPGASEWQAGAAYAVGDEVTYQGTTYRCLQAHTALVGWEPPNVPALWQAI